MINGGQFVTDTVEKLPGCTAVIYQLYVSVDEGAASCTMMAQKMTSREFFNTIDPVRTFLRGPEAARHRREERFERAVKAQVAPISSGQVVG